MLELTKFQFVMSSMAGKLKIKKLTVLEFFKNLFIKIFKCKLITLNENEIQKLYDMIKVLSEILCQGNSFRSGFFTRKNLLNLSLIKQNSKLFSVSNAYDQDHRYDESPEKSRQLPSLIHFQNPITWLINKIDFIMLKNAWDSDFNEEEFKRGVKQAVSVICTLISLNHWNDLRGLVTHKALVRLQRDVEVNWNEEQQNDIAIKPSDIKMVLPRKVHFLRIGDQKFVDVDMICVAMKFKELLRKEPSKAPDIIFIEILTRFHRNYTLGQFPNWTVTVFKLTSGSFKNRY